MKPLAGHTYSEVRDSREQRTLRAAILFDELISGTRAKELLESLVAGFKEKVRCEPEMWNFRVLQIDWARRLITDAIPKVEILIMTQRGDSPLDPRYVSWIESLPLARATESPALIAVLNPTAEDGSEPSKIREFFRLAAARQGRVFFTLTIYPDNADDSANSLEHWLPPRCLKTPPLFWG